MSLASTVLGEYSRNSCLRASDNVLKGNFQEFCMKHGYIHYVTLACLAALLSACGDGAATFEELTELKSIPLIEGNYSVTSSDCDFAIVESTFVISQDEETLTLSVASSAGNSAGADASKLNVPSPSYGYVSYTDVTISGSTTTTTSGGGIEVGSASSSSSSTPDISGFSASIAADATIDATLTIDDADITCAGNATPTDMYLHCSTADIACSFVANKNNEQNTSGASASAASNDDYDYSTYYYGSSSSSSTTETSTSNTRNDWSTIGGGPGANNWSQTQTGGWS